MNTNRLLRASMFVSALAAALTAHAQYRYTFSSTANENTIHTGFTYLSPDLVTSTRNVPLSALTGVSSDIDAITSIDFLVNYSNPSPTIKDVVKVNLEGSNGVGSYFWYFDVDTFNTPGVYTSTSNPATLTIQAVPEPASMAALGLGAAAMLRRRRRSA